MTVLFDSLGIQLILYNSLKLKEYQRILNIKKILCYYKKMVDLISYYIFNCEQENTGSIIL